MSHLVEVPLRGGGSLLVETAENPTLLPQGAEVVTRAGEDLEASLDRLQPAVDALMTRLRDLAGPDEVTLQLGLRFTAAAGVIITQLGSEANVQVTLKWSKASE